MAKFAWMVASNRDSLCMRLVRCKYKVRKDWLRKKPCKSASPIWKAIEKSKKLLSLGACYEVGNRMDINVWQDPWVPWLVNYKPKPKDDTIQQNPLMVSSLINHTTHEWEVSKLEELFDLESVEAIKRITLPLQTKLDKLMWTKEPKGNFTVKSMYKASQEYSYNFQGEKSMEIDLEITNPRKS